MIGGEELNGDEMIERAVEMVEQVDEEWPQHASEEEMEEEPEEEDNMGLDMAESLKSWPVLSKYQAERFKHRILIQGKQYIEIYTFQQIYS